MIESELGLALRSGGFNTIACDLAALNQSWSETSTEYNAGNAFSGSSGAERCETSLIIFRK